MVDGKWGYFAATAQDADFAVPIPGWIRAEDEGLGDPARLQHQLHPLRQAEGLALSRVDPSRGSLAAGARPRHRVADAAPRRREIAARHGASRASRPERARHALDAVDEVRAAACSGAPVISRSGSRRKQLAEHHRDLAPREVRAEAVVRARAAEADVLVRRRASRRSGRDRRRPPRRGSPSCTRARPSRRRAIFWPPSSVSRVAVRRKWITGDAQRTISSTAVGATPSKSAAQHRALRRGGRESAFMPWLIALRVVSLPAATSSTKNEASSWSVSVSPSTSAFEQLPR